jgi:hypothetical protein
VGARGKKSAVAFGLAEIDRGRPNPPKSLTPFEAVEWRHIVSSMRPDYFAPSHYAMLTQLCRHIVCANRVAQLIENVSKAKTKIDLAQMRKLYSIQSDETTSILHLCVQMRLTHRSLYRAESAKQKPMKTINAPWSEAAE